MKNVGDSPMLRDSLDLLLDSMAKNKMRLINRARKLSVDIVDGKYYYEVWEFLEYKRKPKWHYKGNDFYAAMLELDSEP